VTYRHLVIFVSGLFLLPNALIAPAFSLVPALLVVVGCVGSLWIVARATAGRTGVLAARVEPTTFVICWLVALALCLLGGEGHFFFPNFDWLIRDAVLADLVQQNVPVRYEYQGSEFILRAPLGIYMLPAVVGKLLGLHAAHLAHLAQNATILALMLALFGALATGRKAAFLAVFVAFSGVEVVGRFINASLKASASGSFAWPLHAHQHLAWWNPFFQYTNHVAQIFWVPGHALPGWWLAALSILHVRREIGSAELIVTFAFLFFWSPLTMAGALPIVGYLVLRRDFANLVSPQLLVACAAALCFLPVVVYLGADAESVPHGWLFVYGGFWSFYVVFILIQIPHAAVVASFWQRLDPGQRTLSILAIGLLLLIPLYRLGPNNDFSMRASIMPLALLAFVFGTIAAQLRLCDGFGRIAAVAAIIALGCITPALEIQRALMVKTFAISDCNVLTAWNHLEPDRWLANYLARSDRTLGWLLHHDGSARPAMIEDRQCWPAHPYMSLPMTVWQEPENW
jgi:hypothetical protein